MILVTGATGFVGRKILETCPNTIPCPSLRDASEAQVRQILAESGADVIIHTAAIADTGYCQTHPEESYLANVQLPLFLAKAAGDAKLICFSSDQVYTGTDGEGPYTEDMADPANVYGQHKLEMERRVLDIAPHAVMLRAEWMYDWYLKKPNYFMNILRAAGPVAFSSRQFRGITYVKEVAENMDKVIRLPGGVYNFGSETTKSMYEITRDFLSFLGRDIPLEDAPPRHDLWMDCQKARALGVEFSTVENGLRRCARDPGLHPHQKHQMV